MTKDNRLYNTGNSTQCSVVTYMGRKSKKEGMYVFVGEGDVSLYPVSLPGKSHGQRRLVGCSLWGHKESGMTEQLTHTYAYVQLIHFSVQ